VPDGLDPTKATRLGFFTLEQRDTLHLGLAFA
jgi:hypothetical protein